MKTTFFHQEGSGAGARPEVSLPGLHSLGKSARCDFPVKASILLGSDPFPACPGPPPPVCHLSVWRMGTCLELQGWLGGGGTADPHAGPCLRQCVTPGTQVGATALPHPTAPTWGSCRRSRGAITSPGAPRPGRRLLVPGRSRAWRDRERVTVGISLGAAVLPPLVQVLCIWGDSEGPLELIRGALQHL